MPEPATYRDPDGPEAVATVVRLMAQNGRLFGHAPVGAQAVINCGGVHTVAQRHLTQRIGFGDGDVLDEACAALAAALGCDDG